MLDELVRAAEADPDTLAAILHGSRSVRQERPDWEPRLLGVLRDPVVEHSSRCSPGTGVRHLEGV